jgi:multisubunit Na+/H+ antiporter MnhE subunit
MMSINHCCTHEFHLQSIQHGFLFGAILSLIVFNTLLSGKQSRSAKRITAASIILTIAFAPCFYFSLFNIQNSVVRFPFAMSSFVFLLRTLEGKSSKN